MAAVAAVRELAVALARFIGIAVALAFGLTLVTVGWRQCNARSVRAFCAGISPGQSSNAVLERARNAGLEVLAEPNAKQVEVRKRSWAGVGVCTITLDGDTVIGSSFEDS